MAGFLRAHHVLQATSSVPRRVPVRTFTHSSASHSTWAQWGAKIKLPLLRQRAVNLPKNTQAQHEFLASLAAVNDFPTADEFVHYYELRTSFWAKDPQLGKDGLKEDGLKKMEKTEKMEKMEKDGLEKDGHPQPQTQSQHEAATNATQDRPDPSGHPESAFSPEEKELLADNALFASYLRALGLVSAHAANPTSFLTRINDAPERRTAIVGATAAADEKHPVSVDRKSLIGALFEGSDSLASRRASQMMSVAMYGPGSPTSQAKVSQMTSGSGRSAVASSVPTGSATAPASETIRVVLEEAKTPLFRRIIRFVVSTALYAFFVLTVLSLILESTGFLKGAGVASTKFSAAETPDPNDPSGRGTTFKDVHGCDEAKQELYEIVEFLKNPEKFEKLGGRLPRGILLTGPPGTGKTLLARAVAGEAGVPFFTASGSEFDEMYVGVGARRVRELFQSARTNSPAIVFIDELDAIGGKRSPRDQHYVKQTLNQLLVELDGFHPGEGVILIGATNFPESLDKALTRPGRFDKNVVVPLPDVRGRVEIIKHHLRNVAYDKLKVNIETIARGTTGFSGASLQALVNQAAVHASLLDAPLVGPEHFEWAKERIIMGAARTSAVISDKDKLATAYHEIGHALVAYYTPGAYPLHSITVIPRGNALGYTMMLPEMDKTSHSLREYRARLDVAMGGRVAEELIYGKDNITDGASSDISNATAVASAMVRRFGFSDKLGPVDLASEDESVSATTRQAIDAEVKALLDAAYSRATSLLRAKREEMDRLAKVLVERETLSVEQVEKVLKGSSLKE